jgi:opacity protein-like surface antigen
MKKPLLALMLAAAAALPAAAADVGVSISVSEPGLYGRIDIGRFPQPEVVVAQPVIVQRPTMVVAQPQPVYLWVPPGHRKNWKKHCYEYNACGAPVYFVKDGWYEQHVMAPSRGQGGGKGGKHGRDDHRGGKHGHGHGKGRD